MSHPNEALIRNAFNASLGGNLVPLRSMIDPQISWHVSGHGPLSGNLNGLDAVLAWGAQLSQRCGGTWHEEILEIVANDDTAFMRSIYRARRGVRSIEDQSVNVFRIREGRIVECWVFFGDQYGFDEFWS
jgi:uncharacterized protein